MCVGGGGGCPRRRADSPDQAGSWWMFSRNCLGLRGLLLLLSCFSRVRLCDPIDGSPPGSSVPGILQARILEWVAISFSNACMHAKSLQSSPTLCDPMDSTAPGSSVPRILQARTLEWVAISFSSLRGQEFSFERG